MGFFYNINKIKLDIIGSCSLIIAEAVKTLKNVLIILYVKTLQLYDARFKKYDVTTSCLFISIFFTLIIKKTITDQLL